MEHADLHVVADHRRGHRARRRAAGEQRSEGCCGLSNHRVPVVSADDGRGRDHLALDVQRARRPDQLCAARARHHPSADCVSQFFCLGAAQYDHRQHLAGARLLHDRAADRPAKHPAASLRGGARRWRAGLGALLAHHSADAEAVDVPLCGDRHPEFVRRVRPGLCDDQRRPGPRDRAADHLHLQAGVRSDALRLRRGAHGGAVRAADGTGLAGAPRRRRQRGGDGDDCSANRTPCSGCATQPWC